MRFFSARRRLLVALLCMSVSVTTLMPVPAAADTSEDQLNALRAQEASQRASLGLLSDQQRAAQAALNALRSDLNATQANLDAVSAQAQLLEEQIADFQAREQALSADHERRLRIFSAEVRDAYKSGPIGSLLFLFGAASFSDFVDRLLITNRLARYNYDEANKLKAERESIAAARKKTAELRTALDPILADLARRRQEAAQAFTSEAALLSQLESQQRGALAALQGTQKKERQLEAALAAAAAAAAAAGNKGHGLSYGPVCPQAPSGKVSICGHGWGHGVGLAQYGALGMARAGFSWQQIESSFYSGVTLGGTPTQTMRVYLRAAGSPIIPRSAGATIQDASGAVQGAVGPDQAVSFSPAPGGKVSASWSGGSASGAPLRLVPNPSGIFQVSGNGTRYRGEAWVDNSQGFKIINHVDLEAYLQGLAEVPSSWPLAAISAQVVAARTYALYHLTQGGLYDVDDTTNYQVYGGVDREAASQNAAVANTRGQAIFYQGSIIDAVFSSSDGGHTQCASAEWGHGDNPCTPAYLKGVIDNYDVSPLHTWYTPPHTLSEMQSYVGAIYNANACGSLVGFDLTDRDASDRLNDVVMVGTTGRCKINVGTFINAINAGSPADFVVYGEMFGVTTGNSAWPYW
jgi:SpoIID/LytB domain protein